MIDFFAGFFYAFANPNSFVWSNSKKKCLCEPVIFRRSNLRICEMNTKKSEAGRNLKYRISYWFFLYCYNCYTS